MLEFRQYTDEHENIWETINKNANASFLSSIDWINFQKKLGKETYQYLIYSDDDVIGNFYIEVYRRKVAKFAYSPYGPVLQPSAVSHQLSEVYKEIQKFQKDFIKEKNLNLFRIDPLLPVENRKELQGLGYKVSMAPTQAKYAWEIDISEPDEDLLMKLKKVARYNVKKSSEAGVQVKRVTDIKEVNSFIDILMDTIKRHKFASFDKKYFITQFVDLSGKGMCRIYLASMDGKYISGALVNIYNNVAYYSHGGSMSDPALQKYGASYLLHWEIIKDLKTLGVTKYNMWGVVPEGVDHPMQGVSDFKRRFPGKEVDYVGGLDIFNDSIKYNLQKLVEFVAYRNERY